jgi:hypothetical protein
MAAKRLDLDFEDIETQLANGQQDCELVSTSRPNWQGLKGSAEERTRLTGASSYAFSGPKASSSSLAAPAPGRLHGAQ